MRYVNLHTHSTFSDGKHTLEEIVLLPGETDAVQWASFDEIHQLIQQKKICDIIARQFLLEEPMLRKRQTAQDTK